MRDGRPSRRELLSLVGAGATVGLAGCGQGQPDQSPTETSTDTPTPDETPTETPTDTPEDTPTPDPNDCTEVGGSVEAGTTLDGCYLVTETLDVAAGELEIVAGSRLIFTEGTGLEVRNEGVIVAEGASGDPITMVGATAEPGFWKGVAVHSTKPSNTMNYVDISSAGAGLWDPCCPNATRNAGLNVWDGGILTLQNTTLRNNAGYGLSFTSSADLRSFQSNAFAGNGTAAIATTTDSLAALDSGSDYGDGIVEVRAEDVTESGTWVPINGRYHMYGRPDVVDDAVVTIAPGAVFLFAEDAGLRVSGGALSVDADAENIVEMKGMTETPGFWRGLSIQSKKPDNRLNRLRILHGGSGNWDPCCPNESAPANLNVFDDAIVSQISSCTFGRSSNYGMLLSGNSELREFESVLFDRNDEASMWLTANNLGSIDAASDYSDAPVYVEGTDVTEDATWSAINTPIDVREGSVMKITDGASVSIEAGTTFQFRENAGLHVDEGNLQATGTSDNRIVFEGTTAAPGWWKGIAVTSPSRNSEISNADISHGGSSKWDPCCPHDSRNANVNVFDGGYLSLTDCQLRSSENYATWVAGDATLDASGNDYGGDPTGSP